MSQKAPFEVCSYNCSFLEKDFPTPLLDSWVWRFFPFQYPRSSSDPSTKVHAPYLNQSGDLEFGLPPLKTCAYIWVGGGGEERERTLAFVFAIVCPQNCLRIPSSVLGCIKWNCDVFPDYTVCSLLWILTDNTNQQKKDCIGITTNYRGL